MPAPTEDEVNLASAAMRDCLEALCDLIAVARSEKRKKEREPDEAAANALHGMLRGLQRVRSMLGQQLLREIGDSAGVQNAISAFKGATKTLNDAVDAGLAEAAERQKVASILTDLTKLATSLQKIADTTD